MSAEYLDELVCLDSDKNHSPMIPNNVLLKENEDFRLNFLSDNLYRSKVNVTYRSPRKIDGVLSNVILTTTVERDNLISIRVEVIDGLVFVVSDPHSTYSTPLKLCVVSERVANEIIYGLIKTEPNQNESRFGSKTWINRVVDEFGSAILLLCCVVLTVSGTYYLVFK